MNPLRRFQWIGTITILATGIALLAGCSGGGATMQEIDGVLHVMNPAEPLSPDLPVTITEEFTIGSDEMGEEYLFAGIAGMDVDPAGNIYVLVQQDDHIRVYNPDGTYQRTFSRKGQGPGELYFVPPGQSMSFGGDGNLWVTNLGRQRLTIFTTTGDHVRDIVFKGSSPMTVQTTADGFMGVETSQRGTDDPAVTEITFSLRQFNADGDTIDTLFDDSFTMDFRKLVFEEIEARFPYYTQDDQGRIWQCRSRTDAYEVNVFSSTGSLERVVEKDFTPIAKTEQELADEKEMIRELIEDRMQGQQVPFEPSPYKSATRVPYFDPRGYIWIQVQRKDAIWANEFDLLDLEGQWLTTFVLEATIEPSSLVFDGDRVHVVDTSPEDIPKVVVYKVTIGE